MNKSASPKVDVSPYVGFCGGVNRTLKIIEKLRLEQPGKKIYLLGKVVHNEIVLNRMKRRGFKTIDDHRLAEDGLLIIQSHGIPASRLSEIKASGISFVDTTCPMVKDIQARARRLAGEGRRVIIIGDRRHEEVQGIAGQVENALILGTPEEAGRGFFQGVDRAGVVIQSTFIRAEADAILRKIRRFVPDVRFENTICKPTSDRQRDARIQAARYDGVIVIGSPASANTRNLMSIAGAGNRRTRLVSRPEDVDGLPLGQGRKFYVLSGASTPMDVIDRTVARLRRRLERETKSR
ncbi:MAG TPA: 4-hydroxy-3-methylbut-2-enyl diphosphate reductase [Candidatus Aminicenantes bacterium]|nr:4-hydroxy-3-methylbut-2-enyl diphosphate reductase [Candidatus Aminicenantes bacterium]HPH43636.1 4-hydroxy-3-methylbut-2-enyl diphosphate reductase [Candidatus Aminicenantes bacterium]HPN15735.1 4-hydroxy-3-methylbut-2-enyl diphosphate reductase [Candidatus Aminicenantes bacterium]